jgi:hypothetical protein
MAHALKLLSALPPDPTNWGAELRRAFAKEGSKGGRRRNSRSMLLLTVPSRNSSTQYTFLRNV